MRPILNRVFLGKLIRKAREEDKTPLGKAEEEQVGHRKKQMQGPWVGMGCRFWGQGSRNRDAMRLERWT